MISPALVYGTEGADAIAVAMDAVRGVGVTSSAQDVGRAEPLIGELRAVCSRRCEHGGVTNIPRAGSTPISTITGEPVKRVAADATVADVAKALVAGDVGVVVVADDARTAALVSERDVVRVVAEGKDPAALRAVDVASTKLVWCDAEATVDGAAVRMMDRYIRHILVERDGVLVGIVSARDLLGVYCAEADVDFGSA